MFKTNVENLLPEKIRSIPLTNIQIPKSKDVFFRSKQEEIIHQYKGGRLFLSETTLKGAEWDHWFTLEKEDPVEAKDYFKLWHMSYFYEAALLYYNIAVDLSWTITYISIEYVCYIKVLAYEFDVLTSIEEATEILRKAEKNVISPTDENSPFLYLKKMDPNVSDIVDYISEFWVNFKDNDIRLLYNTLKHKGKPHYKELDKCCNDRFFSINVENSKGNCTTIPSDRNEVRQVISLEESVKNLIHFDDNTLYPYLEELFSKLEQYVAPSPLVQ